MVAVASQLDSSNSLFARQNDNLGPLRGDLAVGCSPKGNSGCFSACGWAAVQNRRTHHVLARMMVCHWTTAIPLRQFLSDVVDPAMRCIVLSGSASRKCRLGPFVLGDVVDCNFADFHAWVPTFCRGSRYGDCCLSRRTCATQQVAIVAGFDCWFSWQLRCRYLHFHLVSLQTCFLVVVTTRLGVGMVSLFVRVTQSSWSVWDTTWLCVV